MTAWACLAEEWPARTVVARPADMALRMRASASGSRSAGTCPAACAARNWAANTSITTAPFLTSGAIASAGSVSESAK